MTMESKSNSKDSVAYVNGVVYTVNEKQPWTEAFIVSPQGVFTDIGTTEEIREKAKNDGLVTFDLRGQFIMPGIHDAHMHILYAGLWLLNEIPLDLDTTTANVAERIKSGACTCAYAHVYSDWQVANAFNIPDFDRSCLDEEYPDTPVYIRGMAGHGMFANTALLKKAGYDIENEPHVQGARFVRRADGSLTGELSETAMNKASIALPKPNAAHVKRAIRRGIKEAHKAGVTSMQEAATNALILEGLHELEKEGRLDIDCYTHIVDAPEYIGMQPRGDLQALIERAHLVESKHVHTKFVKFILDGVPLPPIMTHSHLDENGKVEESKITVPDLEERILEHDAKGRTVKIHCTGHGSTRKALDAIEAARKQNPNGPKHEIAHCNSVHADDYPRFQKLNVTAECSPAFFFAHPVAAAMPEFYDWNFQKHESFGTRVSLGGDWGGGFDASVLQYVAPVVEKIGGGSKQRGGEMLCRIMTLTGAEAVGSEAEVGSIEVGKRANFISVSQNLAKGEFDGAKVLKTWFEGEMVWDESDP